MTAVARKYRLTPPVVAEHPLQAQLAKVLRLEIGPPGKVSAAGVVWYSIDHANYAGEVPGVRIARGIIAGILDTFVLYRGTAHFIEIKTEAPDAELSEHQRSVGTALLAAGGRVGVARDAAELLGCLDAWAIPRARRVRL
jgi:hypothetical protein